MELELRVREIIVSELGLLDINETVLEAELVNDLGADSLDQVELVMAFEEEFDIDIPDHDVKKLVTVQDVVDYIARRVAPGGNANGQQAK